MKWPVVLAGLVVGGGVAASVILGGGPEAAADRQTSLPDASRQAQAPATRGANSPETIFAGDFKSPADIKAAFKKQGKAWPTSNLLTFESDNRADCPGGGSGAPSKTLYVRYVTDYPQNSQGQPTVLHTDINVPGPGGGTFKFQTPNITEKVFRDDYQWKRRYQTRWWSGADQEWIQEMRAEQRRLDDEFMQAQRESPQQAIRLAQQIAKIQMDIRQNAVQGLNEDVSDIVEVEAPSTAWSFKYNNHTKKGDPLYRREAQPNYADYSDQLLDNAEEIIGILDPIRQFGENIENGGTRTILGYECEVLRAGGWDAEACMADINGERISLWTRIDKAESTAVHIDTGPCVPMAQFLPPPDVEFDEEW